MKYRIVRNGLGEYAVQKKFWAGWEFVGTDKICAMGVPTIPAKWKTFEEAQAWINLELDYFKRQKDRNTWEVVE